MITMLCYMPNPTDATSLYRGIGPLQALKRKMGNLHLIVGGEANWAMMKAADIVFLQRPALESHLKIVSMAKANRKPVWVDYDDDLFRVPICNRTYKVYSKTKLQNNMISIIAKADVVTVSTPELAKFLRGILAGIKENVGNHLDEFFDPDPNKIVLIPNAYDDELLTSLDREPATQNKLVSWRGSGTHDKDLMGFTPKICNAIKSHLDWTFNFIGEPFWWTIEQIEKVEGIKPSSVIVTETIDPIDYFGFLAKTKPGLMIVPLEDIPFNRCKSNIAWVEATHAGAICLAPDWQEWQRPGVVNYKDADDFEVKLRQFLRGEIDYKNLWKQSRDFIAENLTLSRVNDIRKEVLKLLIGNIRSIGYII